MALLLPRHGYLHDFRTAAIVVGALFLVFGGVAAGGTSASYRRRCASARPPCSWQPARS